MKIKSEIIKQAVRDLKYAVVFPSVLMVGLSAGVIIGRGHPTISNGFFTFWGIFWGLVFFWILWSSGKEDGTDDKKNKTK